MLLPNKDKLPLLRYLDALWAFSVAILVNCLATPQTGGRSLAGVFGLAVSRRSMCNASARMRSPFPTYPCQTIGSEPKLYIPTIPYRYSKLIPV